MKPLKVLQFSEVINSFDCIDTIVQFADIEAFEMSVCVETEHSNIVKPVFPKGTKVELLARNSHSRILQSAWKLSKLLKEWEIDILHAHHFDPALIGLLATRLNPKTKFIFGRHYSDVIQNLGGAKRLFYLGLEQFINRGCSRIIVPSAVIEGLLIKQQGISQEKIDVIPEGVAAEKYESLSDSEIAALRNIFGLEGKFVVVSVGKLTEGKGVRFLAEAVASIRAKIPNIVVLFVGEGEERAYLQNIATRENLGDALKIAGWRTDAITFIAASDIVVQPTLTEAFSQVMGEAMWMSKPLIITDVSGATDIIKTGENGVLVPKANSKALADSIINLFKNPELRLRIGKNGREYVEEHLIISKVIKMYEASYYKTMGMCNKNNSRINQLAMRKSL